jgi:hypothetical protein
MIHSTIPTLFRQSKHDKNYLLRATTTFFSKFKLQLTDVWYCLLNKFNMSDSSDQESAGEQTTQLVQDENAQVNVKRQRADEADAVWGAKERTGGVDDYVRGSVYR